MSGQVGHFVRYAPERIPYAIERYTKELNRLMHVLENRLGEVEYLAGNEFSIADIAVWPLRWAQSTLGYELQEAFLNTSRLLNTIAARPAVQRGHTAEKAIPDEYMQRRAQLSPAEWSNMFGEKLHRAVPGNR